MIRWRGGSTASAAIAAAAAERARAAGDEAGELLARTWASYVALHSGSSSADELERLAQRALPLLEAPRRPRRSRRDLGRSRGRLRVGVATSKTMRTRPSTRSTIHSSPASERPDFYGLPAALMFGPRPAGEALQTLDELVPGQLSLPPAFNDHRAWSASNARPSRRGVATACAAAERSSELGLPPAPDSTEAHTPCRGRRDSRPAAPAFCDYLDANGRTATCSGSCADAAAARCAARPLRRGGTTRAAGTRARRPATDIGQLTIWRQVRRSSSTAAGTTRKQNGSLAKLSSHRSRPTPLNLQGDALSDLAQVLAAAERHDEAAAAYRAAFERYERKQIIPLARRTRERLAALQAPTA